MFLDLDGCLVDSTKAIPRCLNEALAALGLPRRATADLVRFIGPPLTENVAILLAEAGADPELASQLIHRYRDCYTEIAPAETTVIPGIPDALERLAGQTRLAVVTSKPGPFARPILGATGLAGYFVAVHAPELDEQAEAKADTLARALADVVPDAPPARTAMVGDRSHDVVAGRACGTRTVGVTWGAGDRPELEAAGADHLVDTPAELADLLDGHHA